MSRYSAQAPFTPGAVYAVVRRGVLVSGRRYAPGSVIPAGTLPDRLARSLYEQRLIRLADGAEQKAARAVAKKAAGSAAAEAPDAAAPEAERPAAPEPDAAPAEVADAPAPDRIPVGSYAVVRAGMGGWKVTDPEGRPVGDGHETPEAAVAEAAGLAGIDPAGLTGAPNGADR